MIAAFATFVLFQLIGEVAVRATGIPVPGPVIGAALLFATLAWRGRVSDGEHQAARGLLDNLSLLFVPAGAGVMLYADRLKAEWLPIAASLVISTTLTLIVTAVIFVWIARLRGDPGPSDSQP